jgi:predicted MFS family arabinose efflux permease
VARRRRQVATFGIGYVDAGGTGPRSRLQIAREATRRRRKKSLIAGAAGLAILFGSGIGGVVVPGWIVPMTAVMVVGVILLVVAFILAGGSGIGSSRRLFGRRE